MCVLDVWLVWEVRWGARAGIRSCAGDKRKEKSVQRAAEEYNLNMIFAIKHTHCRQNIDMEGLSCLADI